MKSDQYDTFEYTETFTNPSANQEDQTQWYNVSFLINIDCDTRTWFWTSYPDFSDVLYTS